MPADLDLLFYVSHLTSNRTLSEIATAHALKTLESHIRADNSTCHVVDFEPATGCLRAQLTNQGFSDTSCWSRGQAWAIVGFAQAYHWTRDTRFLTASHNLAEYFMSQLPADGVPFWDFNAPRPGPRDTSAGLIATYGLLLLHEATAAGVCKSKYLSDAFKILAAIVSTSLAPEAHFIRTAAGDEDVDFGGPETIVLHATINNYEFAPRRWADHGLVYADYYFLLIGNKLLQMGIDTGEFSGLPE